MAPSGNAATSCATIACSALLYSTTGGHGFTVALKPTPSQPVKKIIAAARAAGGCVQHLAVDGIVALQCCQSPSGTPSALTGPTKVKNEERNGEGG